MADFAQFVVNLVLIPVALGIGVGALLTILASYLKGRLRAESMKTTVEPNEAEARNEIIQTALSSQEKDSKSAFIILAIDIERKVRELATSILGQGEPKPIIMIVDMLVNRGLLSVAWSNSFKVVWDIRNRLVHGLDVSDNDVRLGTELTASLRLELNKIEEKSGAEVPRSSFEIYKDPAGKFRWRFRAPNGEILASSEAYETKEGCINSIKAVETYFARAKLIDLSTTHY